MTLTTRPNLIQRLQTAIPRGAPFDNRDLEALGISSALAHHYVKSGWLSRLGRGIFMFPNDTLREEDCLKYLAGRIPGLHVGGKTALARRGIRHNLPVREPLCLWGEKNATLPKWFSERFRARYTARDPFVSALSKSQGLQPLPETPNGAPVSVPERALLEMLSEVGICQEIEEARHIMEGARSLRSDVLGTFLKNCRSVKVVRLCVVWAEELNLPWASAARTAAKTKWGRSRWATRLKDGTTLILKP